MTTTSPRSSSPMASAWKCRPTNGVVAGSMPKQILPQYVVTSTSAAAFSRSSSAKSSSTATSLRHRRHRRPSWLSSTSKAGEPSRARSHDLWLRRMNSKLPLLAGRTSSRAPTITTHWTEVGRSTGTDWPSMHFSGPSFMQSIPFTAPARNRYYRVELSADGIKTWVSPSSRHSTRAGKYHVAGPSTS